MDHRPNLRETCYQSTRDIHLGFCIDGLQARFDQRLGLGRSLDKDDVESPADIKVHPRDYSILIVMANIMYAYKAVELKV